MQFYRVLLTIVSETVKMSKINWINRLILSRLILAFNRAVVWGTPSPHLMTYSANSQSWAMHVWWGTRPHAPDLAYLPQQKHKHKSIWISEIFTGVHMYLSIRLNPPISEITQYITISLWCTSLNRI